MKTIALIISVVVIPVISMGTIIHQIAQNVECEVEGQKVESEVKVLRLATRQKIYLDMR